MCKYRCYFCTFFSQSFHKVMDIPSNSNVTGNCGESEQIVTLSWGSQDNSTLTVQNNFTLHFVKNETNKLYSLHHLEISLAAEKNPTDKSSTSSSNVNKVAL